MVSWSDTNRVLHKQLWWQLLRRWQEVLEGRRTTPYIMSQYCFVRTMALRQMEFLQMMLLFNKAKHPESAHRGVLIQCTISLMWPTKRLKDGWTKARLGNLRMSSGCAGRATTFVSVCVLVLVVVVCCCLCSYRLPGYPSQRLWKMMKPKAVGPPKPPAPTDPTAVGNANPNQAPTKHEPGSYVSHLTTSPGVGGAQMPMIRWFDCEVISLNHVMYVYYNVHNNYGII